MSATMTGGFAPARQRFGHYEILDLLGQGGMAAVYLAQDARTGQRVAVKVLARMRSTWLQRFQREFEAARRVQHPNVVRVLEAGEQDGAAYFSMERIDGVTAARWVLGLGPDDPLPPPPPQERSGPALPLEPDLLRRSLRVAIQLAGAVGAIHKVGLVHRDLKPGNVLVAPDGGVKLVDFGVAKWLEEQTSFTQVGHVVGSYSYMSPEQITGAEVDHRADLYGLGILLYELIDGAPPFRARRPQEYLWLHCTAQPDPLSRWHQDIPPSLDALLLDLLAKEPADRPDSMRTVQARLEGVLGSLDAPLDPTELKADLDETRPHARPAHDDPDESTLRSADTSLLELRRRLRADPAGRSRDGAPDPRRAPDATASAPELPAQPVPPKAPSSVAMAALLTPRYVGRQAELDELLAQLRTTRREGVRLVVLSGEEGSGKTRLLHTFRGLAWVRGARVAIGRCHLSGGAFCAPFHDILLRLAGPALSRAATDRVLGPDREAIEHFFPALRARAGVPPGVTGSGTFAAGLDDPAVVFRAIGETLRRAALDAPLILGIEDAHWADDTTLRLLRSLLTRLAPPQPAAVLVVLTLRPADLSPDGPAAGFFASLDTLHRAARIAVDPLSIDQTVELIRSVVGDARVPRDVLRRLGEAARGNPRFAVELARGLVEAGGSGGVGLALPDSLMSVLRARVQRLDRPARDVARCIALLGGRPPIAIVQAASGLGDDAFTDAVSELERRRVIEMETRGEQDGVSLSSEALRLAVLDGLTEKQGRALHRRAAAAWLKLGPGHAGQAARHLYAAGEERAAFPHALDAAYAAGAALDYATARRWMAQIGDFDLALDAVSAEARHRYHMLRFLLAFMDGDLEVAERAIAEAASTSPDAPARLDTGISLSRLHTRTGSYLAAVQVCRRGLREAKSAGLTDRAVLFATQGARAARRSGDLESAMAWLQEAELLIAGNPDLDALAVRLAWTRSAVQLELPRSAEAEAQIRDAIELAARTQQERAEAGLRTNLSVLLWRRGEIDGAVEQVERSVRIFEELGELDQVALNQSNLAELRVMRGELGDARQFARACWGTFRRLRDRQGTLVGAATCLLVAREADDKSLAREVLDAVGDGPPGGGGLDAHWSVYWLERARWHAAQDERSVAAHCLEQALRALGPNPPPHRRRDVLLARAELDYALKQFARAAALADEAARGAAEDGHLPALWAARAIADATRARLGARSASAEPPHDLVRANVPLLLHTAYYGAEACDAQGDRPGAELHRRIGRNVARERGFDAWLRRLGG